MTLRPDRQAITLQCDVHKWMNGYGWAFDHPFAAVSKGDRKEDDMNYGKYEISKIPAGAALEVWAWHEGNPSFTADGKTATGAASGVKIADRTLKEGENTLDIKVKK